MVVDLVLGCRIHRDEVWRRTNLGGSAKGGAGAGGMCLGRCTPNPVGYWDYSRDGAYQSVVA